MFPAARKGDPITHDMAVPSGVIEFLPAAHVGCTAICTGVISGGIVHPPITTPIIKGSATVFIHGMPAARWAPSGDLAACGVFLGLPPLTPTRTVLIGG